MSNKPPLYVGGFLVVGKLAVPSSYVTIPLWVSRDFTLSGGRYELAAFDVGRDDSCYDCTCGRSYGYGN